MIVDMTYSAVKSDHQPVKRISLEIKNLSISIKNNVLMSCKSISGKFRGYRQLAGP